MSLIASSFGNLPGMGVVVETFESAFTWGPFPRYYTQGYIDSSATDPTNSPTWEIRMGLVMGKTNSGTWKQYSATATDGSQVAQGVLPINLRMQDVLSGANTAKLFGIMVSGGVKASTLIGLDNMARSQMSDRFIFDDQFSGGHSFPYTNFQNKTSNYQILSGDNYTVFSNTGAAGEVDLTLPAIAPGYYFAFQGRVAQTLKVISNEGGNIIGLNNAAANAVAASTGGQQIGAFFEVFSSPDLKWILRNLSAGAVTLTLS